MIADYQNGGQKMFDIIEFNEVLKISWILKYILKTTNLNESTFLFFIYLR